MQAEQREQRKQELQKARAQAECEMASERQKLEEAALPLMLDAMWAANVMDIESSLKAVCHDVRAHLACIKPLLCSQQIISCNVVPHTEACLEFICTSQDLPCACLHVVWLLARESSLFAN